MHIRHFPGGAGDKNPIPMQGIHRFDPGLGRFYMRLHVLDPVSCHYWARGPKTCAPPQEEATVMRSPHKATKTQHKKKETHYAEILGQGSSCCSRDIKHLLNLTFWEVRQLAVISTWTVELLVRNRASVNGTSHVGWDTRKQAWLEEGCPQSRHKGHGCPDLTSSPPRAA